MTARPGLNTDSCPYSSVQFMCCEQAFRVRVRVSALVAHSRIAARFYPRDAILAVVTCLSVCLCLSVTSRSSIETAERIELVFLACERPSTYPVLC